MQHVDHQAHEKYWDICKEAEIIFFKRWMATLLYALKVHLWCDFWYFKHAKIVFVDANPGAVILLGN